MNRLLTAAFALAFSTLPVLAQWQVPTDNVPLGRGAGKTGFNSIIINHSTIYAASPPYNVKANGSDMTTAMQAALNAACGTLGVAHPGWYNGTGRLVVPAGVINVSDRLTISRGCIIEGQGPGTHDLFPADSNTEGTRIVQTHATRGMFVVTTEASVQFLNMHLLMPNGTSLEPTIKITVPDPTYIDPCCGATAPTQNNVNSKIDKVRFTYGYIGVHCDICKQFQVVDSYFDFPSYTGIKVNSNPNNTDNGIIDLRNNTILATPTSDSCVYIGPQSNVAIYGAHKCNSSLYGYHLVHNGSGVTSGIAKGVVAGTLNISDGSMENQERSSVTIDQGVVGTLYGQVIVRGAQFLTLAASSSYQSSIVVHAGAAIFLKKIIIANNIIVQQGGTNGFVLDFGTTDQIYVFNNHIACDGASVNCTGVRVQGSSTNGYIADNDLVGTTLKYNIGVETLLVDRTGFTAATLPALAKAGSQAYVSDGLAGSAPVTGGSLGCYAYFRNGVWRCP